MKIKLFLSLLVGAAISVSAQQGYKDGIEYFKAGQYANAKTILERTINDNSTDKSLAYYYLGQSELALKNKDKAKAYFDKGLEADPANPYNYVGLGAIDLTNNQVAAAKDNFKKAEKFSEKNYDVLVAIARAYYDANAEAYAKDVADYLAKAHKKSKDQEPSIYILEGDMIIDKAQNDPTLVGNAVAKYEMAIRFDETNPEGYAKYANAYYRVDNPQSKQFAVQKFEEFLAKNPNSALAQRELAEKYYMNDQWSKAAEQYGRYIQNPNHFPEDESRYAVLLFASGQFDQSNAVANRLLQQQPDNFLMQRLLMLNNAGKEDYQAAVKAGEAFFKNNPNGYFNTNDYITYAQALTQVGQDSIAAIQYDAAIKLDPKNTDMLRQISAAYNSRRNYQKAAEAYALYLDALESPSANDYFTASGRWLNASAKAETPELHDLYAKKGIEVINKAIDMAEPNPDLLMRRARLHIANNGNKPDQNAVDDFNAMIALLDQDPANKDPQNPNNYLEDYKLAYNFIGYFYTLTGDKDAAKDISEKYAEIQQLLGE